MKNKKLIIIAIIVLILVIAIFIINNNKAQDRDYNIEKVEDYNYFVLVENEKYGVIDKKANIIIEPKYNNIKIPNPSKGIFIATNSENKNIVLNEKKEEIFTNYELVDCIRLKNIASDLMYEKSVLIYFKDEKYGLINYEGKEITKSIYNSISALEYKEGELLVEKDGKYGVINIKGTILVPIEYDQIDVDNYYTEENNYKQAGYIVGQKTNEGYRYGYIDVKGKEILKLEYNEIERITDVKDNNIYLIAAKNGQYGLLKNDSEILKNEYQSIVYDKTNNLLVIEKSKKFGVATLDGNIIIPTKYSQINIADKYLYATQKNGTTEVFDNKGKLTNMDANTLVSSIDNENYDIKITNSESGTIYSVVNKQANTIIDNNYTYIKYLFNKYFLVCNKEGKLGILDSEGNVVVELKYDSIQEIGNTNLIKAVTISDNLAYIYSPNIEKIYEINDMSFKQIGDFVKIYNNEQVKYFNKQGKEVENKEVYKNNNLFAKIKDGKWGFVDSNDNVKIEFNYDKVTEFNEFGYAGIKQNGKWGVVDKSGKVILEPKYEFQEKEEPEFLGEFYKVTYGFGEVYYTNK